MKCSLASFCAVASLFCGDVFAMSAPESGRSSQPTKSVSVSNIRKSKITESDRNEWFDAAETGNIDKMLSLMGKGIDVNLKKSTWRDADSALSIAAEKGHLDIVRMLLTPKKEQIIYLLNLRRNKAKVKLSDVKRHLVNDSIIMDGEELSQAAKNGHTKVVKLLLSSADIKNGKEKALMWAVEHERIETVEWLLDHGADINSQDSEGKTALMYAGEKGHTETIRLLLDHGADINSQDSKGKTALMYAGEKGHTETIRLLLDHGADINSQNNYGETVLIKTACRNHIETVRLLLDQGADINYQNSNGKTALTETVRIGEVETVKFLLDNGADVNNGKEKALISAVQEGKVETVKFLLDNGADINFQNESGITTLMSAVYTFFPLEVVELLLDRGADVNLTDRIGNTALDHARRVQEERKDSFLLRYSITDAISLLEDAQTNSIYSLNRMIQDLNRDMKQRIETLREGLGTLREEAQGIISLRKAQTANINSLNRWRRNSSDHERMIQDQNAEIMSLREEVQRLGSLVEEAGSADIGPQDSEERGRTAHDREKIIQDQNAEIMSLREEVQRLVSLREEQTANINSLDRIIRDQNAEIISLREEVQGLVSLREEQTVNINSLNRIIRDQNAKIEKGQRLASLLDETLRRNS